MRHRFRCLPSGSTLRCRMMRRWPGPANFTIELIERFADPIQHLLAGRGETVDPRRLGPLGFRGSKPAARGHPRQHRIQRARAQAIAVALQLLEHPLAIDTLLVSMMKD